MSSGKPLYPPGQPLSELPVLPPVPISFTVYQPTPAAVVAGRSWVGPVSVVSLLIGLTAIVLAFTGTAIAGALGLSALGVVLGTVSLVGSRGRGRTAKVVPMIGIALSSVVIVMMIVGLVLFVAS